MSIEVVGRRAIWERVSTAFNCQPLYSPWSIRRALAHAGNEPWRYAQLECVKPIWSSQGHKSRSRSTSEMLVLLSWVYSTSFRFDSLLFFFCLICWPGSCRGLTNLPHGDIRFLGLLPLRRKKLRMTHYELLLEFDVARKTKLFMKNFDFLHLVQHIVHNHVIMGKSEYV